MIQLKRDFNAALAEMKRLEQQEPFDQEAYGKVMDAANEVYRRIGEKEPIPEGTAINGFEL